MDFSNIPHNNLLTNLPNSKKFLILRAAELTPGFKGVIYVEDKAVTLDGEILPGYIAVKTHKPMEDHSAFWKTFHTLKKLGSKNTVIKLY